nr:MAG TPA: hypothetical protein [Caudoviricetes sp.]
MVIYGYRILHLKSRTNASLRFVKILIGFREMLQTRARLSE